MEVSSAYAIWDWSVLRSRSRNSSTFSTLSQTTSSIVTTTRCCATMPSSAIRPSHQALYQLLVTIVRALRRQDETETELAPLTSDALEHPRALAATTGCGFTSQVAMYECMRFFEHECRRQLVSVSATIPLEVPQRLFVQEH